MIGKTLQLLKAFGRDRSAVGATEFAIVAPVLLVLYVGGIDVTRAITFSHKMQNATTAVNDLVTQEEELTREKVALTFGAADAILAQYRVADLGISVSNVQIDSTGTARVLWTVARNMTGPAAGSPYTLPSTLEGLRDFTLVVTETSYEFAPLLTYVIESKIPLSAHARGRFRGRQAVVCEDCTS